jgi:hypothetical protein
MQIRNGSITFWVGNEKNSKFGLKKIWISKEIFSLALNIEKSWYIKDIILEKPNLKKFGILTIQIDFERGTKFTIKGGEVCSVYQG